MAEAKKEKDDNNFPHIIFVGIIFMISIVGFLIIR
jgi:hypothetical protein